MSIDVFVFYFSCLCHGILLKLLAGALLFYRCHKIRALLFQTTINQLKWRGGGG